MNEARVRAGSLATGRCVEADAKPPYAPWAEVIAGLDQLGAVPKHDWRELPRLVPVLGSGLQEPTGSKYALFEEIVQYLRLASAAQPTVIIPTTCSGRTRRRGTCSSTSCRSSSSSGCSSV
jgi:hypothetical protein